MKNNKNHDNARSASPQLVEGNSFGPRHLKVASSPEVFHLADAGNLPLKNAKKQKTSKTKISNDMGQLK
jgi:hypothetical protein